MLQIIPEPQKLEVDYRVNIYVREIYITDSLMAEVKEELENFITEKTKYRLDSTHKGLCVDFEIVNEEHHKEWYSLVSSVVGIKVCAVSHEGIYRAIQTLKQILMVQPLNIIKIEDYPVNDFRSFMLDVGRYYYPVEDVLKMIDYISLYKFNYFHFHLTEDQGWRFESDKYPKLTEKGSYRSHTNFNCKPEGGYYTKEQLKQIVDYCHKKFIKVIPEIDMPGHTMSALACYPELSCFNRKLNVATHWGVKYDIMCAGKDFTYQFCYDIIDESCEIFTDEYIHIGGDEAPKKRWKYCEHCNAKLKELGLEDFDQLQFYFANNIASYAKSKGKKVIMWNVDYPNDKKSNLDNDIILQWYSKNDDVNFCKKVDAGTKTIISNSGAYYIDLPYGYISLKDSYTTECIKGVTNKNNIVGMETCLWTEYVKNIKKAKFNSFPRLLAISEVFWTDEKLRNYQKFLKKLPLQKEFLAKYNIDMPKENVYNPSKFRAFFSKLWFEKRQLTWQGLYLIIDNAILKSKIKRMENKKKKL